MSKFMTFTIAAVVGVLSVHAHAGQEPVTRAQVKAELAALQAAGYHSSGEDPSYPVKLQAALARSGGADMTPTKASGYGAMPAAMSESGRRNDAMKRDVPVYRGR